MCVVRMSGEELVKSDPLAASEECFGSSLSCSLSSSGSPPASPPSLLPPGQDIFTPNPLLLHQMREQGIPLSLAKEALFRTGNCAEKMDLAMQWIMEVNQDNLIRNSALVEGGNVIIGQMVEEEDDSEMESEDSDMESDMMLMLLVNESLNLSSAEMSLAGARATAKMMKQVKEVMGVETMALWCQWGRKTVVKEVVNTEEMYSIKSLALSGQLTYLVEFDQQWVKKGEERQVMALFGDIGELELLFGNLL